MTFEWHLLKFLETYCMVFHQTYPHSRPPDRSSSLEVYNVHSGRRTGRLDRAGLRNKKSGRLIQSQPRKSMQDCTTTSNVLQITKNVNVWPAPTLYRSITQSTVGLMAVGNVQLLDEPSVTCWWSCTWQHTSNVLLMLDMHVNLPVRKHSSFTD